MTISTTERKFTRQLCRLIRQPYLQPQWKLTSTDGHGRSMGWASFKFGSHIATAVTSVTIKGKAYWAAARMVHAPMKGKGLMYLGFLGLVIAAPFNGPKVELALWKVDPRDLEPGQAWYSDATEGLYTWASQLDLAKL